MPDKKITDYDAILGANTASGDLFEIVDISANDNKKITRDELKAGMALNLVDNTADLSKPISTATQTALNLKEDTANKSTSVTTDQASNTKYPSVKAVYDWVVGLLTGKQDTLVSGTNIKTINSTSLLGSGDIVIASGGAWGSITGTLSNQTDLQTALDAKQNKIGFNTITASGTEIVLTNTSNRSYVVTGSGGQTFKLPDATTLNNGDLFYFNNNQSSGAITINNNSNTLVASVPSGGYSVIQLLSNSIAAGSWERHELAPSNVTWSTNTLDYAGSITSATWNGVAIADGKIASAATWNGKTDKLIIANRQTASYTLVIGDADELIEMNVGTANNLTVPPNSSVAFAVGTQIIIAQYGAGQTTIVAGSGVTVRSSGGKLKLTGQYSGGTLIKIATDEWYAFGDLSA